MTNKDSDIRKKIQSLQQKIKEIGEGSEFKEVIKNIIKLAEDLDSVSPEQDRLGCGEDFCGTWDDLTGTWQDVPGIKSFIKEKSSEFSEKHRKLLVTILLKKYASHEPGGRTACLEMFLHLLSEIPEELMDFLVRRVCNSAIDRTHLSRKRPLNLLEKIAERVSDNSERSGIISLRLSELCEDDDQEVRKIAKSILSSSPNLDKNAVNKISKISVSKINNVKQELKNENFLLRWRSALLLSRVEVPSCSLEPLLTTLDDSNAWVRSAAAFSLSILKEKIVVDKLIETLARDKDEYVRVRCAYAIGQLADPAALWRLINLFDNEVVYCVRFAIKYAVAQIMPSKAIQLSLKDLNSENPSRRLFGAEDLRKIKWKNKEVLKPAIKALVSHFTNESLKSVRRASIETLIAIGGADLYKALGSMENLFVNNK